MQTGKVLAIDYGTKHVGLAIGNFETKLAFPHGVISNKNFDFLSNELIKNCLEWEIEFIVFGMPFNMNNDLENPTAIKVKKFVEFFKEKLNKSKKNELINIKITFFDERLSTFEANSLINKDFSGSFKKKLSHKDSLAAKIILDRFFASQIEKQ